MQGSSSSSYNAGNDDGGERGPIRSKGLLPAIGVGAAVYFVTGFATVSTLGLVGLGAGVGYGVGSWIADKFQKKDARSGQVPLDQLPWAVQVALQQWQEFVMQRSGGRPLAQGDVESLWAQFEQIEPTHAANARALVRPGYPGPGGQGVTSVQSGPGGPTFVATVPCVAAEV
mmetsp:Transcript_51917/g.137120  ORF Transcript_51917/g.137120 Transcript_51917/m.137120 type:complete len:172 (+) Transcript_51917:93-608(+)